MPAFSNAATASRMCFLRAIEVNRFAVVVLDRRDDVQGSALVRSYLGHKKPQRVSPASKPNLLQAVLGHVADGHVAVVVKRVGHHCAWGAARSRAGRPASFRRGVIRSVLLRLSLSSHYVRTTLIHGDGGTHNTRQYTGRAWARCRRSRVCGATSRRATAAAHAVAERALRSRASCNLAPGCIRPDDA